MNKRITSLLLCFVMVFSLLFTALPVFAVPGKTTTLTARPDKATASPGETITYTVTLGAVEDLLGIKFKLIIPEGLTFVTGAEKAGVKEALGATSAEFTPSTKVFLADPEYTGTSDLDLMTFECTVDSGASGNLTVQLYIDDPDNYYDSDGDNIDVQVTNATITVTAAPKPATGISLNKSTLELTVGESETLVATVEPADTTDTVTWDTGRSDVATVDSTGKVTAVAPGTAVIAARAGEKSAFCTVTVVAAPCTHTNKTPVSAKSSTCKVQGWDAYSKCNDCGQLFDKDGNAISAIPYLPLADHTPVQTATAEYLNSAATCTSPAVYYEHCSVCDVKLNTTFTSGSTVPHTESGWKSDADGHWKECTVCGTTTTAKVAHTRDHEGQATEEYAIKCTACDYVIEAQLSHTHSLTPVAANPATCTTDGNTAYYVCSCGKWFADAAGNEEITDHSSVVIGHPGHDWKDATCTAPKTCGRCGETEGVALGHNYTKKVETEAYLKTAASKCTEYNVYWYACSRCDVSAKDDAAATDKYYTSTTAGNHSFTEKIEDAAHYVAGTGTNCQSVKKYYYDCAYCDQIGTTTWDSTTYGEHNYAAVWSSDESGHWHECSLCHDKKDEAAHTAGEWITDTEATATTDGTKHKECTKCGYVMETGTIPATGGGEHTHSYGSEWKSDADKHWHECSCGAKAEEAAHTASNWILDTPATAATAVMYKKCTVCDYVMSTITFPAIGSGGSGSSGGSSGGSTTPAKKPVQSVDTGDMGIALYAGMALLSLTGGAWVVNKKRKGK